MSAAWPPAGWERRVLDGTGHHYYVVASKAADAPSVLVLHEFPGMSDTTFGPLVDRLAKQFRVVAPSVLGRDGRPGTLGSLYRLCVRREIHILATDGVSRAARWIREVVAKEMVDEEKWGVVGMCMTGNFALALAVDPRVHAAVVAEPAVPVCRKATGLDQADLSGVRANPNLRVRAFRFAHDPLSPARKLRGVEEAVGAGFVEIPLESPHFLAHSTLTDPERTKGGKPDAVEQVVEFLTARLSSTAGPEPQP